MLQRVPHTNLLELDVTLYERFVGVILQGSGDEGGSVEFEHHEVNCRVVRLVVSNCFFAASGLRGRHVQ